jgi:AcrR family transcriptional regulator
MAKRKPPNGGWELTSGNSTAGHTPSHSFVAESPRPRGRPRTEIDPDAVADAVAKLFAEGGMEAVSIVSTARELDLSRATLYRAIPTKEHLLGILFERSTRELTELATATLEADIPVAERLRRLVELQVDAAARMRHYLSVFFGSADLPADVVDRWHAWSREYEELWTRCVEEAIDAGVLDSTNVTWPPG